MHSLRYNRFFHEDCYQIGEPMYFIPYDYEFYTMIGEHLTVTIDFVSGESVSDYGAILFSQSELWFVFLERYIDSGIWYMHQGEAGVVFPVYDDVFSIDGCFEIK